MRSATLESVLLPVVFEEPTTVPADTVGRVGVSVPTP